MVTSKFDISNICVPSVLGKLRRTFSVFYPHFRGTTLQHVFDPFFSSGPSVGGRCAEQKQLFEILKQTCPERIVLLYSS